MHDLCAVIEALIFASDEPVSIEELSRVLEVSAAEIQKTIEILEKRYQDESHGIFLKEYSGGYLFVTKPGYSSIIKDMHNKKVSRLSQAALETLAIIAYKQPVTRVEIEEIRGVKAEKTLLTLTKYGLIEEIGRKDTIGNPIVYGTTEEFLKHFDLRDLSNLPHIEEDE
ncbi:MAG: SMC-Scp complex subunit ScpB [Halanaerobiaceae bacterium]|jgi:segregation and condensation protein B|nr:SMC-Scp complex subunit ScpB [Halanaerobiaceae bacterium]